jgi:hypothetical protein
MMRQSTLSLSMSFDVKELIAKLKENKAKHLAVYEEAVKQYRIQLIATLVAKLEAAKVGKKVKHDIDLNIPVKYDEEYDNAIAMLEDTKDTTVVLSHTLYSQLVRDQWDWQQDFASNSGSYLRRGVKEEQGV